MSRALCIYRIRVQGVASDALRAAFDDVEVSDVPGQTLLCTGPVDTATFYGLVRRIESLGLVLGDVVVTDSTDDGSDDAARGDRRGEGGTRHG